MNQLSDTDCRVPGVAAAQYQIQHSAVVFLFQLPPLTWQLKVEDSLIYNRNSDYITGILKRTLTCDK